MNEQLTALSNNTSLLVYTEASIVSSKGLP